MMGNGIYLGHLVATPVKFLIASAPHMPYGLGALAAGNIVPAAPLILATMPNPEPHTYAHLAGAKIT